MKILMTGARGFLGEYISRDIDSTHTLVRTDSEDLDVTNYSSVVAKLENAAPEAVIHLAALCGAIPSVQDPHRFYSVNFGGTLNILEACRRLGVKKLLFTSSLTVFGKSQNAVTEDSAFNPRHPYAASKTAAEFAIRNYVENYGMSAVIMRPTLVVGEGCKELHAIGDFLATLLRGEKIEIFGDGSHVRDFIHPDDVVSAAASCLTQLESLEPGRHESFNFSTGEALTISELARTAAEFAGRDPRECIAYVPSTSQTFSLFTEITHANERLGWEPKIKVADIFSRLAADSSFEQNKS